MELIEELEELSKELKEEEKLNEIRTKSEINN